MSHSNIQTLQESFHRTGKRISPSGWGPDSFPWIEGATVMILPLIAQLQCLSAQPWSEGLVHTAGYFRYNHSPRNRAEEPRHAADPFDGRYSESLTATLGLKWGLAGRRAKACEGLNPHRTGLGLARGFVQPASI